MKAAKQNEALSFFVALFFALGNTVTAQAQVVDTQSFFQSIKDTFNQVKESETVVKTMDKAKKMSAAIGTAKKTMTELKTAYETKIKANMEKIQKYADKAKEYKEKYDKYKAQLDSAIDKAKDLKDKVEDGIDKAKELKSKVEDGIDKAKDLKDKVQDGIDTVKSKTDSIKDKAGVSAGATGNGNIVENTEDKTSFDTFSDAKPTIPEDVKPIARQPFVKANVEEDTSNEVSAQDTPAENDDEETGEEDGAEETAVSSAQTELADENVAPAENDGKKLLPINKKLATGLPVNSKEMMTPLNFDAEKQSNIKDKLEAVRNKKDSQIKELNKAVANINKEKLDNKIEDARAVKSQIVNSGKINNKVEDVKPIMPKKVLQERSSLRKIFKSSSLRYSEKLAFAKAEAMPDGGTDANGTLIVPEKLAMFCNLSSDDAQSGNNMQDCLLKLNQERTAPQANSPYDAPTIYNIAMAQYAAAGVAEAFKALNDAESFEEKIIEPIDFADEPTAQDVYSNIVEMNKAIDQQMNGLLKIYSAQLVTKTIKNFGDYIFLPPEEEDENG